MANQIRIGARAGSTADRRESMRLSPVEGRFGEPGQIINHRKMKQLRGVYGAIHLSGAMGERQHATGFPSLA